MVHQLVRFDTCEDRLREVPPGQLRSSLHGNPRPATRHEHANHVHELLVGGERLWSSCTHRRVVRFFGYPMGDDDETISFELSDARALEPATARILTEEEIGVQRRVQALFERSVRLIAAMLPTETTGPSASRCPTAGP